ncbi:MAG: DUF1788 domain-containing protein [Peptococcaceae bacterium]|nr:DUF1788 domain-containing protein [Peptococcaceae bacterium]
MTIHQRLDRLLPLMTHQRFRENKGLGNEIGFYIFDYDPQDELVVREHIPFVMERAKAQGLRVVEFDLYNIMIKALEDKGYLQKTFELERLKGSEGIIRAIRSTLRLTQPDDLVVQYIKNRLDDCDVVFLTGVGKAWPIIRSHSVLNVLHPVIDQVPLIVFYPGTYSGQDLNLFNEISDQNYYRAFKLVER